jgi:hypothetical protein
MGRELSGIPLDARTDKISRPKISGGRDSAGTPAPQRSRPSARVGCGAAGDGSCHRQVCKRLGSKHDYRRWVTCPVT